jgi:2-methylisocitrate lyase-like PEP mutase family enzyme
MNDQQSKAAAFRQLHVPGDPLVLFNVWDAGSARAVASAGAKAIATGSHSVAGALGYDDAEATPLDAVIANLERICASVDLPVTLDFESAYARAASKAASNVAKVIDAGAVGINFEDQIIGGEGLYLVAEQCERIAAIRKAADAKGTGFYLNARTDIWLSAGQASINETDRMDEALARLKAYADAGADGFFIPGLVDEASIEIICRESPLPVNVMMFDAMPSKARLAELGVARISHGPGPWRKAMEHLTGLAREAL